MEGLFYIVGDSRDYNKIIVLFNHESCHNQGREEREMFVERFINSIGIQFIFAWSESDGWMVQLKFETKHDHSHLMDLGNFIIANKPAERWNNQPSQVSVSLQFVFAWCGWVVVLVVRGEWMSECHPILLGDIIQFQNKSLQSHSEGVLPRKTFRLWAKHLFAYLFCHPLPSSAYSSKISLSALYSGIVPVLQEPIEK